jgi:SAM-dependent methyltransferase
VVPADVGRRPCRLAQAPASLSRFQNRTRTSPSIAAKLLREGRFYLLPVYALMRSSYLASEAIANSGSYEFADHIYGNRARGSPVVGKALDRLLLSLPSARAFRLRYLCARHELEQSLAHRDPASRPMEVLSVPCGLARELFDAGRSLNRPDGGKADGVRITGIDLDGALIDRLNASRGELESMLEFRRGDALSADSYPRKTFDVVVSLGFTEFLSDEDAIRFLSLVHDSTKPGGKLITSGMNRHPLSDYMLRNIAELHAHYRDGPRLEEMAAAAGFARVRCYRPHRLLTMLVATA